MISITDGYTISNINIIRQGNLVHFDCSIKGTFSKGGRQLPIKILSTEILPYNRVDAVANGSNDAVTKLYPIGIVFSTSGMVFTYITDPGIDETIVTVMLSITYSVN